MWKPEILAVIPNVIALLSGVIGRKTLTAVRLKIEQNQLVRVPE
jgi:hypothetical protein